MKNPFDRFDPARGQPKNPSLAPAKDSANFEAGKGSDGALDPRATEVLAHHWILTGNLPQHGVGDADRARIVGRAAEMAGATNLPTDQAGLAFARYRSQFGGHPSAAQPGPAAAPSPANGKTHGVFQSGVSAWGERMVRSGASAADINRTLAPLGYRPVTQSEVANVQNYLTPHPHYSGFFQATRIEGATGPRALPTRFSNSAPGPAAGNHVNGLSGGHLDAPATLAGGGGRLVHPGLARARSAHPPASPANAQGAQAPAGGLFGASRSAAGVLQSVDAFH